MPTIDMTMGYAHLSPDTRREVVGVLGERDFARYLESSYAPRTRICATRAAARGLTEVPKPV
jgi:hypothetical protein